ncbi:AMP-binding protein [Candidatus Bathyarchaeota archaeon]|nr:AMP-binding protein [Candidatus Bathyarchaeota archaeon]
MALSYSHGSSNTPLIGETIGGFFDKIVAKYPERDAVVANHQNIRYSYIELRKAVDQFAKGLIELGVGKSERVGIWSPNNVEWLVTQFATAKIGAILVNINPSYRIFELEYALKQSGVKYLILATGFKKSDYVSMVYELIPETKRAASSEIVSGKLQELRSLILLSDEHKPGMLRWMDIVDLGKQVSDTSLCERQETLQFDDPVNIQYTSGTTGFPKGATLSHFNILNNGFFVGEMLRFSEKDRLCIPVPFYHCFGMVLSNLTCVTHGATMVLPSEAFDAGKVLEVIEKERCTALHGVPTMFIAELNHPDFSKHDLSSLRTGIMAGAPCPIEVMKKVIDLMGIKEITIAYGMTETSPVSLQTSVEDPVDKRVTTVGRAIPHIEIKIIDPSTGQTVPHGVAGEICVRGYLVMLGYWDNLEATREVIDQARWMHTGDIGVMQPDGYINIVGRLKDMIIRGGENIYPREIEELLHTHPEISDAQVIGVPSEKYGEEVMAWIKLKENAKVTEEDVTEFCRDKISYYKIPRYIKFVDEFPMTVTGKIQKFKIKEMAVKELGLERAKEIKTA